MTTQQDLLSIFDEAVLGKLRKAAVNKREQILNHNSSTSSQNMAANTEGSQVNAHTKCGFKKNPAGSSTMGGGSDSLPKGFADEVQRMLRSVLDECTMTRHQCERNMELLKKLQQKVDDHEHQISHGCVQATVRFSSK